MPWPKGVPHRKEMIEKAKQARASGLPSLEERFWARVDRRGDDDCWLWTGTKLPAGYGTFGGKYKKFYGHRFSFELKHGPIPEGLEVLHRCDHPACVNPAHLFLGTQIDNMTDMIEKGRGFVPPPRRGEEHSNAKLTATQIINIRKRHSNGEGGYGAFAKEFGVNRSLIASIVKRRVWRHI